SPDGRTLAAANDDQSVHLWDLTTGQELRSLRVEGEEALPRGHFPIPLGLSPDGKTLVEDRGWCNLRLWDVHTGLPRRTIKTEPFGSSPQAVAFTPQGLVGVSGGYSVPYTIWKVEEGKPFATMAPGGSRTQFRLSPGSLHPGPQNRVPQRHSWGN